MACKTFVEKMFNGECGSIVFEKPNNVLTHNNAASIEKIFNKMGGEKGGINVEEGKIIIGDKEFNFAPLPDKLMKIFEKKGLVNYLKG